jgi:methyl acetate hydrolase
MTPEPEGQAALCNTISTILTTAVHDQVVTGLYVMTADRDGITYSGGAGTRDGTNPWTDDTIAWLASMTKPIVAVAALQLVERGLIELDTPTTDLMPELAAAHVLEGYDGDRPRLVPARGPITLRMLLSHTAGTGYSFLHADLARYLRDEKVPSSLELKLASIVDAPLVYQPGTNAMYGTGLEWVGLAITRLTGHDLATHLHETIFSPLGMRDTTFGITDRTRLAGVHTKTPQCLVPTSFELPTNPEFHSGGGGLYGTARDYLTFLRMLSAGGTWNGVQYLRPETLVDAQRSHSASFRSIESADHATSHDIDLLPGINTSWSLLGMRNEQATPAGRPVGTMAWAGGANTYYWADTDNDRSSAGVLFTQLIPFADPQVIGVLTDVERAVRAKENCATGPQ